MELFQLFPHNNSKNRALSFCCSKEQRQSIFLNLNFQIIIASCLLGISFILPTGWLVEGNKGRRLHTGEATDIIGKWSWRQHRQTQNELSRRALSVSFSFAWMDNPLMIYLPFIKSMPGIFSAVMDKTSVNWLLPAEHCAAWGRNWKQIQPYFIHIVSEPFSIDLKTGNYKKPCFSWSIGLDQTVVKDSPSCFDLKVE